MWHCGGGGGAAAADVSYWKWTAAYLDVTSWQRDIRRERSLVVDGAQVLRATAIELWVQPPPVGADLRAIGVPRVVSVSGRHTNHAADRSAAVRGWWRGR